MTRNLPLALLASGLLATTSLAGDLTDLPKSEEAFQEKIDAFISPGSKVSDAVFLLEAHDFRCTEVVQQQTDSVWCDRRDGTIVKRRYQVVIVRNGELVSHAKAYTGLVGP